MMFIQEATMKTDELLPLFGAEILFGADTGGLDAVKLYALVLDQNETTVYAFDFCYQLRLRDGVGLRLPE